MGNIKNQALPVCGAEMRSRNAGIEGKNNGYRIVCECGDEVPRLKYTGESICLHCHTIICDGCAYEPKEGQA